jgi:ankyrin repeat protein
MSDALPLPPLPNPDQYAALARDLQRACESADTRAVGAWATRWLETLFSLRGLDPATPVQRREIDRESERVEQRWKKFKDADERRATCLLADAQLFVAREQGFTDWDRFIAHIDALTRRDSPVSIFEAAVDAIVAGDAATLGSLLRDHPELATARSTREHESTLLHYISANGVEDFRQKTPPNIVEITRMLLAAGADVNATSRAYGGGSTALGLTATSVHPQNAGVQIPLLETLLDRGAKIEQGAASDDGSAVTGCLANGQPDAARFLVSRGAVLNLEGAAGLGRLDVVADFFTGDGALRPIATREHLERGFLNACGYGHIEVVRFLLDRGVDPNVRNRGGETGLHWTSFGPEPAIARLLLERGAAVDVRDSTFQGTPLDWALFSWGKSEGPSRERGYELAAVLVRAGATLHIGWIERDAAERIRTDARMQDILRDAIIPNPPDAS